MIDVVLDDVAATEALGATIATVVGASDVVLLVGELGAGKTTLVRGLVRGLGGADGVTSPTFTLRHEYDTIPALTHVDCWRLSSVDELDDLGLDEVVADGGALVIEWGTLAASRFGADALCVMLDDLPDATGRLARLDVDATPWAARAGELFEALRSAGLKPTMVSNDSRRS
jgi:tRNA threonylcarbamoyl adenosine modification protein YjeE